MREVRESGEVLVRSFWRCFAARSDYDPGLTRNFVGRSECGRATAKYSSDGTTVCYSLEYSKRRYRELEREGWVEFRRGSGVYVRDNAPQQAVGVRPTLPLDAMIASLIQAARASSISPMELKARFLEQLEVRPPVRLLLIESDVELRKIVLTELHAAIKLPEGFTIGFADIPVAGDGKAVEALIGLLPRSLAIVLPSKAEALRALLPASVALQILKVRSIPQSLAPWLPAPGDTLVGVASRWPPFLEFAKTMLVAAGLRSTRCCCVTRRSAGG